MPQQTNLEKDIDTTYVDTTNIPDFESIGDIGSFRIALQDLEKQIKKNYGLFRPEKEYRKQLKGIDKEIDKLQKEAKRVEQGKSSMNLEGLKMRARQIVDRYLNSLTSRVEKTILNEETKTAELAKRNKEIMNYYLTVHNINLAQYELAEQEYQLLSWVKERLQTSDRTMSFEDWCAAKGYALDLDYLRSLCETHAWLQALLATKDAKNSKDAKNTKNTPKNTPDTNTNVVVLDQQVDQAYQGYGCTRSGGKTLLKGIVNWANKAGDSVKNAIDAWGVPAVGSFVGGVIKFAPLLGVGVLARKTLKAGFNVVFNSWKGGSFGEIMGNLGTNIGKLAVPGLLLAGLTTDLTKFSAKLKQTTGIDLDSIFTFTSPNGTKHSLSSPDGLYKAATAQDIPEEDKRRDIYPYMVLGSCIRMPYSSLQTACTFASDGKILGVNYSVLRQLANGDTQMIAHINNLEKIDPTGKLIFARVLNQKGVTRTLMENNPQGYLAEVYSQELVDTADIETKKQAVKSKIHQHQALTAALGSHKDELVLAIASDKELYTQFLKDDGRFTLDVVGSDIVLKSHNQQTILDFANKKISSNGKEFPMPLTSVKEMLWLADKTNKIVNDRKGKFLTNAPFFYKEEVGNRGGNVAVSLGGRKLFNPFTWLYGKNQDVLDGGDFSFLSSNSPTLGNSENARRMYTQFLNDMAIWKAANADEYIRDTIVPLLERKYGSAVRASFSGQEKQRLIDAYMGLYEWRGMPVEMAKNTIEEGFIETTDFLLDKKDAFWTWAKANTKELYDALQPVDTIFIDQKTKHWIVKFKDGGTMDLDTFCKTKLKNAINVAGDATGTAANKVAATLIFLTKTIANEARENTKDLWNKIW